MIRTRAPWLSLVLMGVAVTSACDGCDDEATSPTAPAETTAPEATSPEETLPATASQRPTEAAPTASPTASAQPTPTTSLSAGTPTAPPPVDTPTAPPPVDTPTAAPPTVTPAGPTPTAAPGTPTAAPGTPAGPTPTAAPPTPTAAGPTPSGIPETELPQTPTAPLPTPTAGAPTASLPPETPTAAPATPTIGGPTASFIPPTPTPGPLGRSVTVKVVDYATGQPISGAQVYDGSASAGFTDPFGLLTFDSASAGALTVTAARTGYHFATVEGAPADDVRLPLRKVEGLGNFGGDVDFSAMGSIGVAKLRLGLVTRSVLENPVGLDFTTIVGTFHTVELCGASFSLPSNFVGAVNACDPITDYVVPTYAGDYSTFTFVGDLPYSQAYSVLGDPDFYKNLGQVFATFQTQLRTFAWEVGEVSVGTGAVVRGVDPAPSGRTNAATQVVLPTLPPEVSADTPPLTFLMADMGDTGSLPIGLAGGAGTLDVYHAPDSGALAGKPLLALSMAAAGGVGDPDAPYTAVMARQASAGAAITLPPWLPILYTRDWDTDSRSLTFDAIAGADLYVTVINFHRLAPDLQWDIYQIYSADDLGSDDPPLPTPGGTITTVLPAGIAGMPTLNDVHWQVSAYDVAQGSFEEFTDLSGLGLEDARAELVRMSRHFQYNIFR